MEEESTVQTGQEEAVETSSAFDDGWADDDFMMDGDGQDVMEGSEAGRETETESEGTEADADQQEADGTEGEEDASPEGEGEGGSDQSVSYTIKHLGEEKVVSGEDIIPTLQKGVDYDRVRSKWEEEQKINQKLRGYEIFLQELADARGDGSIDNLIDETRTRALIAKAEAKGEKLDPAAAAAQAVKARMQPKEPETKPETAPINFDGFLSLYGETVNSQDIPKEVWDDAFKTGELLGPYQRYLNKKLEEDNKKLQKELEQAKQQQKNRERSMGSSRSVGSAASRDSFDEGWSDSW